MADNTQAGAAKRKVAIEDLLRYRLISDPQVSSDGTTAVYVLTRLRRKKNDYASDLWLVPLDGSREVKKLTGSGKRDMSPRWATSGEQIAFLSTRSGKPQAWVIDVAGGEARQVTHTRHGVKELAWSPDGRWIAFVAGADTEEEKEARKKGKRTAEESAAGGAGKKPGDVSEEGIETTLIAAEEWPEDDTGDEGDEEAEGKEKKEPKARVITRVHYKADGVGFQERRSHLFLVPARGGQARQLTEGDWDAATPRWSPDGGTLAFRANLEPDAELSNIQDIFTLPLGESGKPGELQRVTAHDTAIRSFEWLPGGQGFALLGHKRVKEGALGTNIEVWTLDPNGEMRSLTGRYDFHAGTELNSDLRSGAGEVRVRLSPDGQSAYFLALMGGSIEICSVPLSGGGVKRVALGERHILNFDLGPRGIAFVASDPVTPDELYACELDGSNEHALTAVNRDAREALDFSPPTRFTLERPGGAKVEGWIILPPDAEQGKKYPLAVEIHGGPHTAYGNSFMHEFQSLAASGYAVLYTNPRGSQGYGQQFSDAILEDWGGVDYEDIMACVDYAIEQGNIDGERMGAIGGSYGGYMTGWIVGHTDRFKAAVASRMVSNLYSAWGSGDFTWMLWNWEMQGMPQEKAALYLERSPISYAKDVHTPLLITHAEDDHRCSIEQTEQMYTALKVLGREAKMVVFPSGGHDISRTGKPSLRVERLRHIVSWLDEHCK